MSIIFGPGISIGAGITVIIPAPPANLWAWGKNDNGQLGLGDKVNWSSPVQVGALSTWAQISGNRIGNQTHAVKTDGTLWAWGPNYAGKLGLGDTVYRSSPVQVGALTNWTNSLMPNTYSGGGTHVKSDGTAWFFGIRGYMFNNGFGVKSSSPVQVASDKTWSWAVTGPQQSWFGITTGGQLWSSCYGSSNGLSGQNNTTKTSSPVQVGSLTNWAGVYPGYNAVIARKTDGTIWSWGKGSVAANAKAFLGQNSAYVNLSSPTQIGSLTNWARVSAGRYACLAVKTDGTLWTWGYNGNGALGLGDTINRSSPTQVGALTNWLTAADKNVMAANPSAIAVKGDGTLWTWGRAANGTLGNNSNTINLSSPTQLGSLTDWTNVGCNYNSGFAIAGH